MNHRLILRYAALIGVFTAGVFILSGIIHDDGASAAATKTQSQTSGTLRVLDETGKPTGECPLKRTEVKAAVSGFISRVTVTQDFENPFADKIEAIYTFPLPEAAAVDDLTMVIGDRTIKGSVMRREDAAAAYSNARKLGKVATLLDQERPNIFRQQVANILPGQQIRATISYVETLKYEEGSYQWAFPMVVAPRYDHAGSVSAHDHSSRLSPPRMPEGMRAGHDVTLEIKLNAGVPITGVNSTTHEIVVQQIDEKRAVVTLKDLATIPNKDFLLTYAVAGDTLKDAVLAHHSDRGGFFTLILQPPQRVHAEDVMPKEMVFVLDTSGSMQGFPLNTAKKTMELALETLYPHDTFNLITFSGDTEILFPEPVPATPENLRKAKKFLKSRESDGGTEMMKAIKAALNPSDSQQHVRLACFLTDGQVGNDNEILAEVQKHRNARVFAMGFGYSPNRALLDKMTEYGRGEVDYVSETSNKTTVARRFNDRIRNPLLTDVSVEWSNLSITEVFPKRVPDVFSVRPLILSGRYTSGGKGTIRLKGKMAGQDFVREIPVVLPEREKDNDALSTLWARYKIEELTAQEIASTGDQVVQDQRREEIAQLGLTFKLMTHYTSFVAIDDVIFTGSEDPRSVDVPIEAMQAIGSGVGGYVLVTASSCSMLADTTATSRRIMVRAIEDLPLQGRSIHTLLTLVPGTAVDNGPVGDRSINFNRDGVNTNFGIAPGGESPGTSAAGSAPALTASGGANGIVSLAGTDEITIRTSAREAENNRGADTHISLRTRTGTNSFQGSAFYFFGNDSLDANDSFANARGLKKPPKRLNLFGASLGGPILRDKTFFFASYEGLRLRQPLTGITDVPSIGSRQAAPDALRSFLDAFPVPNGASKPDGFAVYANTFSNPAQHEVGSVRIDHVLARLTLRGRSDFADSAAKQRGTDSFSLNTSKRIDVRANAITGSMFYTMSPTSILELHANYSRYRVDGSYLLDEFGGATPPDLIVPPSGSFAFDLNSRNAGFMIGDQARSTQRQFNLVGNTNIISHNHSFKFGADYRRLSPVIGLRAFDDNVLFDGVAQAVTATATRVNNLVHAGQQTPLYQSLSLYVQDQWKKSPRLTLHYGLRWELAPAPSDHQAPAVDQVDDPATLQLAPDRPLWNTSFGNFAPNAAFAYQLIDPSKGEFLLRAGVGIGYDLSQDRSGDVFANSIPFILGSSVFNSPYPMPLSSNTGTGALPLTVFDPQLKSPYTINWNVTVEKPFGQWQTFSAAYVGSSGRRLLRTRTLFDQNPVLPFLRIVTNDGSSDYQALAFTFDRHFHNSFKGGVFYSWSHSKDDVMHESDRNIIMASLNPELDRGPSDFDRRHQFAGSISYSIPALFSKGLGNTLLRKWSIDSIFNARSAKPLNVLYMFPTSIGLGYFRPDVVSGVPLQISDPAVAGGRKINADAFRIPTNLQQGNLGRNSLRGFPVYQIDLALRRKFNFTDGFGMQIQADAFNVLNQANFEDPLGNDLVVGSAVRPNSSFGQSASLRGRSLSSGGFPSFYGSGGARTVRFSVKMFF